MPNIRELALDATDWKTPLDFYAALLPAIGAPAWHGESIAAINDSMIGGGINALKPPYVVKVYNLAGAPADVAEVVEYAVGSLARTRADFQAQHGRDVKVSLEIVG